MHGTRVYQIVVVVAALLKDTMHNTILYSKIIVLWHSSQEGEQDGWQEHGGNRRYGGDTVKATPL